MASFLTFNNIRSTNEKTYSESLVASANRSDKEGATFLSYSTQDKELLPTIIGILGNHGTSVYAEKEGTSLETTGILRRNITLSSKIVLFVTPDSKDNCWNSWLLGLADAEKNTSHIALFPAANKAYDQQWSEQEYLGLYDRIVWGHIKGKENEWLVLNNAESSAVGLSSWLNE